MTHETEFDDSGAKAATRAFTAFADAETVGPSPVDTVMADGRRLRTRRRTAFSAGMTVLAVMPMAAVVAYGTTGSSGASLSAGSTTRTAKPTATTTEPEPVRPTGPKQVVTIAQGTVGGQPWRLVRDRYSVQTLPVGDGSRNEPTYCEKETFEYAGHTVDYPGDPLAGCGTADYVHMAKDATGLYMSGWVGTDEVAGFAQGDTYGTDLDDPLGTAMFGDVDPAKVASVSLTSSFYGNQPAQPVLRTGNEPVAYFVFVIPGKLSKDAGEKYTLVYHFFDAKGKEIGSLDVGRT